MTIEFSEKDAYHREYYRRNSEKIRARQKAWRKNNPEKIKEAFKKSIAKDPEYYRILTNLCGKLWRARKNHAPSKEICELEIQLALHKESKKNRKGLGPRKLFP